MRQELHQFKRTVCRQASLKLTELFGGLNWFAKKLYVSFAENFLYSSPLYTEFT